MEGAFLLTGLLTGTATAPEAVRTLCTKRETTPEGFHGEVLSDHIARNREASQQVNHPRSLSATRMARVRPECQHPDMEALRPSLTTTLTTTGQCGHLPDHSRPCHMRAMT
jgi:hypothetical protein